jgi:hypothetical protein
MYTELGKLGEEAVMAAFKVKFACRKLRKIKGILMKESR